MGAAFIDVAEATLAGARGKLSKQLTKSKIYVFITWISDIARADICRVN